MASQPKRRLSDPDVYGSKRRRLKAIVDQRLSNIADDNDSDDDDDEVEDLSDAHAAILLFREALVEKQYEFNGLGGTVPLVVLQHQVYTLVPDRTQADRQIEQLRLKNVVRVFKLGNMSDEIALMLTSDYTKHTQALVQDDALMQMFLKVVEKERALCVTKIELLAHNVGDVEVRKLIGYSCLTIRDATSVWFAIPNAGSFMKSLRAGREKLIKIVKASKFREALERDVKKRKLKGSKLGMQYHVADAVGAGSLVSVKTTSGDLLRFPEA